LTHADFFKPHARTRFAPRFHDARDPDGSRERSARLRHGRLIVEQMREPGAHVFGALNWR